MVFTVRVIRDAETNVVISFLFIWKCVPPTLQGSAGPVHSKIKHCHNSTRSVCVRQSAQSQLEAIIVVRVFGDLQEAFWYWAFQCDDVF